MMNMALSGKSHAGIRTSDFDEGEVASAKPRRGSLLYRMVRSQTVALALVLVTMSAYSATYYTKKDDPGGTYSFYNKGSWTSGEAPTAGNTYIATNLVRVCGGKSDAFVGDSLQIGEVGGEDGILAWIPTGTIVAPNLILANGQIRNGDADAKTALVGTGTSQVTAPASAPFVLGSTASTSRNRPLEFLPGHQFTGGEAAALKIWTGSKSLSLYGGSPDYHGTWLVTAADRIVLGSPDAFGGSRTEATPNAIQVDVSTTFKLDYDGVTTAENRGVTVASGKALTLDVPPRREPGFSLPITGGASVTVAGEGLLTLANVSTPVLNLSGAATCLENFTGTTLNVGADALLFGRYVDAETSVPCVIPSELTSFTAPDKLRLSVAGEIPFTNASVRVSLLQIPTSVRLITEDDIELILDETTMVGSLCRNVTLEIVTEANVQTVFATLAFETVYDSTYNSNMAINSGKATWSDNAAIHKDADYIVGYNNTTIRGVSGATFAGRSLSLLADVRLASKGGVESPCTVEDLRLWPGASIGTGDTAAYNCISGAVTVCGSKADGASLLELYSSRSLVMMATLHGMGTLVCTNESKVAEAVQLKRDNSAFTGRLEVYGQSECAVEVTDEANLGGNPPVFDARQLCLRKNSVLHAVDSFAIDDENRGITVEGPTVAFNVDADKELRLETPVAWNSEAKKTGDGTLGLGGTASGDSMNLTVSAGWLKPITAAGTMPLKITMNAGTGLAFDLASADEEVHENGLYVTKAANLTVRGDVLPIRIDGEFSGSTATIGLLNVPVAMADALEAKLQVLPRKGKVKIVRTLSQDETRVQFSARVTLGGLILLLK